MWKFYLPSQFKISTSLSKLPISAAWDRPKVIPFGICGGRSGNNILRKLHIHLLFLTLNFTGIYMKSEFI
jgi:hypothetical protein